MKRCSWVSLTSPNPFGLKQRSIRISSWRDRSSSQRCHCSLSFSPMMSSHSTLFRQSSCRSNFALITYGATKPNGSNKEHTTDNIPLLVVAFWLANANIFVRVSHTNSSISTFHFRPSVHSVGRSSISKLTTDLARSDSGISESTLRSLLIHFISLNPPFFIDYLSWLTNLLADSVLLTDFIKSSTDLRNIGSFLTNSLRVFIWFKSAMYSTPIPVSVLSAVVKCLASSNKDNVRFSKICLQCLLCHFVSIH